MLKDYMGRVLDPPIHKRKKKKKTMAVNLKGPPNLELIERGMITKMPIILSHFCSLTKAKLVIGP